MNRPFLVISLDGGGVKGLASAQFLSRLDDELLKRGMLPVRDQVDLVAGCSIGALIACGLTFLGLKGSDIAALFTKERIDRVLRRSTLGFLGMGPVFTGKRDVLRDIFGDAQRARANTLVLAYDAERRRPLYLRSCPGGTALRSGDHQNVSVLDAVDASSAVPGLFPGVRLGEGSVGIDGFVVSPNPSMAALGEALRLGETRPVYMISVGTGIIPPKKTPGIEGWGVLRWFSSGRLVEAVFDGNTDNNTDVARDVIQQMGGKYLRVDLPLPEGAGGIVDGSDAHLKVLRDIGNRMFETFGDQTIDLIREASGSGFPNVWV